MDLRVSSKKQAKIRLALQGCAGSGKTYSSLLIAYGMAADWSKIAIIDSENGSADLYAHLGNYNVLSLSDNFSPENYIKAIEICENAGMEVIIIDSISHAWDFLLEVHANMVGNSFTNWGKITPRQNAFIQKILHCKSHIIATMRTKQDYVLSEKNGKMVPEKVGLKSQQRDGVDYEFTLVFDLDIKHNAVASKDRTSLFMGKPDFVITENTGRRILDWCNNGMTVDSVRQLIQQADSVESLAALYHKYPEWFTLLSADFSHRKSELQNAIEAGPIIYLNKNISANGINHAIKTS